MSMMRKWIMVTVLALVLMTVGQQGLAGQVVEGRDAESNPASVIFRSTLYGVGTGVVLAGAYTLISEDDDAWDAFRWGAGGGAVAGLVVGLIYVATRSEPEDDEAGTALIQMSGGSVRVSAREVIQSRVALPDRLRSTFDLRLLAIRF